MESSIIMLDELADQTTKQLLENVVKRKRKFDKLKWRHFLVIWTSVFYTLALFYYLYKFIMVKYSYSFADMFSVFIQKQSDLYLLLISAALFGAAKILYEKKEKAEKEYHALRCEIIDRSKDLWKEERWKSRHKVFEMMKKEYDINLYHESK
ncbi:DUF2663 family protein [Falsibacillus pallidus]|uniref:Uncharacterized protein DUF2663 n=1 Tax=Falsibacillus pallidus TaxID=493781 RepID=A0A370GGN9_9BACI|nr:DUF2663 family protein [Falsibacillus pallidus]RDI42958.1 uncharacterized protein DUF2663 [Falsibacillus pallidus]